MESTGTKWRTLLSMMYQMFFSFGFMILGGLSYNWRNWHELEVDLLALSKKKTVALTSFQVVGIYFLIYTNEN